MKPKIVTILIADDDPEDRMLAKKALLENRLFPGCLHFVENGEELLDYLHNKNQFKDKEKFPFPGIILLDLNMPKKDGREALKEIKSDTRLSVIPIIALTTSKAEEDILKTYKLGVNSYITKPVSFESLVQVMRSVSKYWFEIVELPNN
ncbi:MAG: two-component system response regulator [Bacteroidetes bacterium RIFCSPLOWO2_02_FULL_36_8]|nr:MAG: two-component system response regulator [Bacteroidetes bacterium RIFCSPLOWO2_02_FULL_36_8]OFY69625.1 MAG: two-component system response regulator [Bacteroidetes bacterium RIFCSPLOWO2_12_FULL_37_12]